MSRPSHYSWFDDLRHIGNKAPRFAVLHPCYLVPFRTNMSLSTLFSKTLSLRSSINVSDQVSHKHARARKTRGKIIVLCILIFRFLASKLEDKNSVQNDSKHFSTSICFRFIHEWNLIF
jgi:hypothetical protein